MTGVVVDLGLIRCCPEMDRAHAAVKEGDYLGAGGHYVAAAQVAFECAARAAPDSADREKWAFIGELRMAWGLRAAAAALESE